MRNQLSVTANLYCVTNYGWWKIINKLNEMERNSLIDDYEHSSEDVEYVLENILQDDDGSEKFDELRNLFNSSIAKCCECESDNCENCEHGGNYKIENGELILKDDRQCKDLIYECHEACRCTKCFNKLVQFGPKEGLEIKYFDTKGLGLVSNEFIKTGSFVCEYAGEILTKTEATRRDQQNQIDGSMNYIFCLNEISSLDGATIQTFIDPSRKGNIGRYINHSCDANCDIISTRVDSLIPKIAIFANRDIPALTEITFSYGFIGTDSSIEAKKKCSCGSKNCKFFLPNLTFQ